MWCGTITPSLLMFNLTFSIRVFMDGFVGRSEELRYLNSVFQKSPVSCAICGRRHLGKTAIIREFCKDKLHLYISGTEGLADDNLRSISGSISGFHGKDIILNDIEDLFPTLKKVCGRKQVVVVIDRYADLVENFPQFTSYLKAFMNRDINGTKIMLLVCDNDNSLFGRFYYTLDVRSMNYRECAGFHPEYTSYENLMAYSIIGGTPAYHRMFEGNPDDVVRDKFFDHMSVFSLEAESMVNSETNLSVACSKVLSAMASGAEGLREIVSRTNLSLAICSKALEDLEHKGMIIKEVSSGPSKRTVYSIHSNILRFFYEVVNKYSRVIEFDTPSSAYELARKDIGSYMERSFKTVCMDYVTLRYKYSFVGKLRKRDDSQDSVVDFVASILENDINRTAISMCRLYGDALGKEDYDRLVNRGRTISGTNRLYMLFSGVGFTQELEDIAEKDHNLRLVTLDDLYRI